MYNFNRGLSNVLGTMNKIYFKSYKNLIKNVIKIVKVNRYLKPPFAYFIALTIKLALSTNFHLFNISGTFY